MDMFAYVYVNEPEIDRLYAQHNEWIVSERLESEKKTVKGGGSVRPFGIGIDVGGNKEIQSTDYKELSFAHKVKQIQDTLQSSNRICNQISEAIDIALRRDGLFINVKMPFVAPQFKEANALDLVNQERHVILESQIGQYFIIMSLGLENMPRLRGHSMSRTSHDAILFREIPKNPFDFNVFGFLCKISSDKLQIRPITVSL